MEAKSALSSHLLPHFYLVLKVATMWVKIEIASILCRYFSSSVPYRNAEDRLFVHSYLAR